MLNKLQKRIFWLVFMLISVCSSASNNIDSLYQELKKPHHDTTRVGTLNLLAKQLRTTDIQKAVDYAKKAYSISLQNNFTYGAGSSADLIGALYLNLGAYKQALRYHFIAIGLFERIDNKRGLSFAYNNLGAVYSNLKDYKRAEAYYLKAVQLKKERNATKELSSTYINLGNVKMHQDSPFVCIKYYEQGLSNAQKHQDKTNITIALMNLGEAYLDIKENKKALNYYGLALAQDGVLNNVYHKAQIYFGLGKIYTNLKMFDKAEWYYNSALQTASTAGIKPIVRHVYKYYSKMYEAQNKPDKALAYLKLYDAIDDTLYNEENTKNINEMQAVYESEQKDRQIELLNKNKLIAEGKLAYERLYRNIFFVGFLLLLFIAFVLKHNVSLKQRVNKVLEEKNKEIEQQQQEIEHQNEVLKSYNKELRLENISAKYEVLKTKVNPHFLFNSLSTLSGLIIEDTNSAHTYVTRFAKLYRYILDMDNVQLITLTDEINFVKEYVALQQMRFKHIKLVVDDVPKNLLVAPFAIQFMVENAIKHNEISAENELKINVLFDEKYIVIKNNLNEKIYAEHSTGIGQKNIVDRYKALTALLPVFGSVDNYYIAKIPTIIKP